VPADSELVALARAAATAHNLDPALVCAICEQESSWNPWALRFEPAFERRYIHPALPQAPTTEELCLAISWGLMQVMGQVAREHGFAGASLASLCDPATAVDVGCRVFAAKLSAAGGRIENALLLWNGGSNQVYPSQVLSRLCRYGQSQQASVL
jgi:soluble lytic murein transglycosylase-like protein